MVVTTATTTAAAYDSNNNQNNSNSHQSAAVVACSPTPPPPPHTHSNTHTQPLLQTPTSYDPAMTGPSAAPGGGYFPYHHQQPYHLPSLQQQQQQQHYTQIHYYPHSVMTASSFSGSGERGHSLPSSTASTPRTSLSVSDLCNPEEDDIPPFALDPDVQMAAEALGALGASGGLIAVNGVVGQSGGLIAVNGVVGQSGGLIAVNGVASQSGGPGVVSGPPFQLHPDQLHNSFRGGPLPLPDGSLVTAPLETADPSSSSSSSESSLPSSTTQQQQLSSSSSSSYAKPQRFMQRVSNIPIVRDSINSFSNAYEATKNLFGVVKYSAETVETGVKAVSVPVLNTLEPALKPLDRFACSQLDRLERNFPSMLSTSPPLHSPLALSDGAALQRSMMDIDRGLQSPSIASTTSSMSNTQSLLPAGDSAMRTRTRTVSCSSIDLLDPPPMPLPTGYMGFSTSTSSPATTTTAPSATPPNSAIPTNAITTAPHIDRKPRSLYHKVVSGVGSVIMSDETIRGIKYCLQWLEYATNNIDRQIAILRDFIQRATGSVAVRIMGPPKPTASSSSSSSSSSSNPQPTPPLSPNDTAVTTASTFDFSSALLTARREIVETLRRVVDILSRYAAHYLPPPARRAVRQFVLALPERWAATTGGGKEVAVTDKGKGKESGKGNEEQAEGEGEEAAARRVLVLAEESSAMIKGVKAVFAQTEVLAGGGVAAPHTTPVIVVPPPPPSSSSSSQSSLDETTRASRCGSGGSGKSLSEDEDMAEAGHDDDDHAEMDLD